MGKKIKVLQINASEEYGGVSSMLFNIYKNIDRDRFSFVFLSPNRTSFKIKKSEINQMGGKALGLGVHTGSKITKHIKLYRALKVFLSKNQFDIIHINSGSKVFNALVAYCCRNNTKSKIIVHSHNGNLEKKHFDKIIKNIIARNCDKKLSCSKIATKAMFQDMDNVEIIKNDIEIEKFSFDKKSRVDIRKEFSIGHDELVVCNVGRLTEQKNQLYLLEIFSAFRKNQKSKLIIVGSGELEETILKKAQLLGLKEDLIILKNRNDMPKIYSATDIFVLPSLYEGLPVSAIEAQANGLPVYLSSIITKECNITDLCKYISNTLPPKKWSDAMKKTSANNRTGYTRIVRAAGFDIVDTAKRLENIYSELLT